jgi:hypothetical protein
MIVFAIGDRTGQIRESYEDNSDNNALQPFGRKLALGSAVAISPLTSKTTHPPPTTLTSP